MARQGMGVRPKWPKALEVMTGVEELEVRGVMESLERWFESLSPGGCQDWQDSVARYQGQDGSEFILISSFDIGQIVSQETVDSDQDKNSDDGLTSCSQSQCLADPGSRMDEEIVSSDRNNFSQHRMANCAKAQTDDDSCHRDPQYSQEEGYQLEGSPHGFDQRETGFV